MATRGRPMKRVSRKEIDVSDHKTYPDGTYENTPPVTIEPQEKVVEEWPLKDSVRIYNILVMDDGTQWQVLEVLGWGLGLVKHPRHSLPSLQDAKPFSWEDLIAKNARKV